MEHFKHGIDKFLQFLSERKDVGGKSVLAYDLDLYRSEAKVPKTGSAKVRGDIFVFLELFEKLFK